MRPWSFFLTFMFLTAAPVWSQRCTPTVITTPEARLMWTAPAPQTEWTHTGIVLERQEGSGAWESVAMVTPDVTEYTDTGLTDGATYTWRAWTLGRNTEGEEAASAEASWGTPPPCVLVMAELAPTLGNLQVTATCERRCLRLTWESSDPARRVDIWRQRTPRAAMTLLATVTGTAYVNPGLQPGQLYCYQISWAGEAPSQGEQCATAPR